MHIYAFGSVCRGEIDVGSDIDLIAITDQFDARFDPSIYSIYSYHRLFDLWEEGNPFAWHLALESKLIFSSDGTDYICELGLPSAYKKRKQDCLKFYNLFVTAFSAISEKTSSPVFELSTVFLAIRNFATCYSLRCSSRGNFSRFSAIRLEAESVPLTREEFSILERSRIISTRGLGQILTEYEFELSVSTLPRIKAWMEQLLYKEEL